MQSRKVRSLVSLGLPLLLGGLSCAHAQSAYSWMSPEVPQAWAQGYKGQGASIIVVDDFSNRSPFWGNLGPGWKYQGHGYWTGQEALAIAPSASVLGRNWSSSAVPLVANRLNILNLSYGLYAPSGYSASNVNWAAQEQSIINYAKNGSAVVVKAAGNDAVAVGAANSSRYTDYLNLALKGAPAAIYVGALSSNGTPTAKASMASYSNYAGSDPSVQKNFLVVGVNSNATNLAGTSFAAPIISGYAAILGSKFTSASATQIANQLLTTARTDTVRNYSASVHGRGEASLTRALAPVSIR